MSTSDNENMPQENYGNIDKLVQIANVYGSVNFHSPVLLDKITEAVRAQRSADDVRLMRQSAARVLSLLRTRNALYASLDDEIWEYVFKSIRELRDAFSLAAAELQVDGPESIQKLLEVMVEVTREYLAGHEARYIRFMQSAPEDTSPVYWEREWPDLARAAQDLLWLRTILVAAIQPLNSYVQRGEEISWRDDITMLRFQQTERDPPRAPQDWPRPRDDSRTVDPSPPSLAAVQEALGSDSVLVRLTAVRQAAAASGSDTVSLLIGALRDNSHDVREVALNALRAKRSLLDDETMLTLAQMGHKEFAKNALLPGGHSLATLIAALRGPDASQALRELSQLGDVLAVRPILDLVPDWQWPWSLDKICAALMRFGPAAVPEYENALRVDEESIRGVAAEMLAIAATSDMVAILGRAAADPSEKVRAALVRGLLIRREDPQQKSLWLLPMLQKLMADPYPRVRDESAQVIERLNG
jgi:hypothetical protein